MTISVPVQFQKRRRLTLSEEVAAGIKELIITDSLKPGDRLPTEQELAERFGVSRVTVREATKVLSFLGILHAAPRRGLTIGELDMSRITEYMGFHFAISQYPHKQLLKARKVIEVGAIPFVAEEMKRDPELYDRLLAIINRPGVAQSPELYIEADIEFHDALMEASGIEPLKVFDDLLHVFFNKFREQVAPDVEHMKQGIAFHRQIIDALRDGESEKAQDILCEALRPYQAPAEPKKKRSYGVRSRKSR